MHTSDVVVPSGALLINGDWVADSSEGRMDRINPATGLRLGSFALAGVKEVDAAVEAARQAAGAWKRWAPPDRRDVLLAIARLLQEHDSELGGPLEASRQGTPFKRRRGGSAGGRVLRRTTRAGSTNSRGGRSRWVPTRSITRSPSPARVVAVIIPWNGPVVSAGMKVAPALRGGQHRRAEAL